MIKRLFDFISAFIVVGVAFPVLSMIWLLVRKDGGPAIFKQVRAGKDGSLFQVFKFRSMVKDAEKMGTLVTAGHDSRITRIGHFLRKTKLDELPQLLNVICGDMSIVGPRPEVPFYVIQWPAGDRGKILSVKPGITDYATLLYNDEQEVLAKSDDPERTYLEEVMPHKLVLYRQYIDDQCFFLDIKIIVATLMKMIGVNVERILGNGTDLLSGKPMPPHGMPLGSCRDNSL